LSRELEDDMTKINAAWRAVVGMARGYSVYPY
jgi:hypothetical protein